MIDWLDFVVPVVHTPIPAGRVISVSPDGVTEYDIPKRMKIAGSFESSYFARSQGGDGRGNATELFLSGNPAKFLQGHNVFGSADCIGLASAVVSKILGSLDIPSDLAVAQVERGNFSVKRIDITRSFAFANREEVKAVLGTLAVNARSRMGRAQTRGGTVYFGQNSSRHSIKYYCKGEELEAGKKHKLPPQLENTPLKSFADNLLRAEVTLRSKELKENLKIEKGHDLPEKVVNELYWKYFGRVEVSAQAQIASHEIEALPRNVRSTYLLWKEGVIPRNIMSKATFYRHRAELMYYGVDISLPYSGPTSNVIPLFREVVGTSVDVPDWAYTDGLIFQPKRKS